MLINSRNPDRMDKNRPKKILDQSGQKRRFTHQPKQLSDKVGLSPFRPLPAPACVRWSKNGVIVRTATIA